MGAERDIEKPALTDGALVDVIIAGGASVARWTVAVEFAIDRIGVTLRSCPARITDACVINVTKQTCSEKKKTPKKTTQGSDNVICCEITLLSPGPSVFEKTLIVNSL